MCVQSYLICLYLDCNYDNQYKLIYQLKLSTFDFEKKLQIDLKIFKKVQVNGILSFSAFLIAYISYTY